MNYLNEAVLIIATYILIKAVISFKRALKIKDVTIARKELDREYEKKLKALNSNNAKMLLSMARQIGFAVSGVLIIASSYALYFILK